MLISFSFFYLAQWSLWQEQGRYAPGETHASHPLWEERCYATASPDPLTSQHPSSLPNCCPISTPALEWNTPAEEGDAIGLPWKEDGPNKGTAPYEEHAVLPGWEWDVRDHVFVLHEAGKAGSSRGRWSGDDVDFPNDSFGGGDQEESTSAN